MLLTFKDFFKLRERQSPKLARQSTTVDIRKRDVEDVVLPPRSRRGGARLLCGLHHRHVGYNASLVHPCRWQVHGISIAKTTFSSGCALALALGAGGFRVFMSHDRPCVSVRVTCGFT